MAFISSGYNPEKPMEGRISDAKTQVCVLKAARILGI